MALKNEALRNGIKQTALLRSKLKGTSYFQEVTKMKAELEAKLLKDNQELAQNNQKLQNHSEFDPELYTMGAKMASYHIGRGTNSFSDFSIAMINDLGIKIKPFLKSFYEGIRNYPGIDNTGMTLYDEVNKINLDDIELSNKSPNIIEDVERHSVRIESHSQETDYGIRENKTSFQTTGRSNRQDTAKTDSKMEKQNPIINRIGLVISFILLTSFIVCLYLIALGNRYMVIDNPFILDKWTKTIYLMNDNNVKNHKGYKIIKWQDLNNKK